MDFQLALAADDRVHRTGDGLAFKEGALQASFVAADAGADVLGTALHRFSGPFGIGLQGRPSTTKSPLPLWMMSSAYSGSVMEPEAMMGHVDAADAALFQFLGQIDRIFNAEAVRFIVGAAEADGNGVVRSDLSTYILEDLEVNAGAVFQRAAVHVGTMVGGGGEEVGQQISVGAVELHQLEACLFGAQRRVAEAFDDFVNLEDGQLLGNGPQSVIGIQFGPGDGRGRARIPCRPYCSCRRTEALCRRVFSAPDCRFWPVQTGWETDLT